MIIKMDKKTYYVAVDKNRTWRSIKSGTKNIAQTYICIHGDLRKKSTLELQKANALEKKMSKCQKTWSQEESRHISRIKYKIKSKMQTCSYRILDFAVIRVVKATLSNPFRQWLNRPIPNRIPIRASVLVNMENVSCSRFAHRRRVRVSHTIPSRNSSAE